MRRIRRNAFILTIVILIVIIIRIFRNHFLAGNIRFENGRYNFGLRHYSVDNDESLQNKPNISNVALIVKEGKRIQSNSYKTVLVSIINDAYMKFAYSWLCNTKSMDIHRYVLFIVTDTASQKKLSTDWPEVTTVALTNITLTGDQDYSHVGYIMLMIKRTEVLLAMLNADIQILLFETDFVWIKNPLPYLENEFKQYDVIGTPVSSRRDLICGCFLYMRPSAPMKSTWQALYDQLHNLDIKMRTLKKTDKISEKDNDQTYLSKLIMKNHKGIQYKILPIDLFPDGKWYEFSKSKQDSLDPYFIHNNWIIGNNAKLHRAKKWSQWFLQADNITCDTESVGWCLKVILIMHFCGIFVIVLHTHTHNNVLDRKNSVCVTDGRMMPIIHLSTNMSPQHSVYLTDGGMMPLIHPSANMSPQHSSKHSLCVFFQGRLGNQMFQFASNFGTAAMKGMSVVLSDEGMLQKIFKIDFPVLPDKILHQNCTSLSERFICSYDSNLLKFDNNKSYALRSYLQSWKYFYNASEAIRKQFRFSNEIDDRRKEKIKLVLNTYNLTTRSNVTLIGVHVRRGDYLNKLGVGYTVATSGYLRKAVNYFLSKKFHLSIFLVFSNDMNWTETNMPPDINVEYMTGNTAELDLALLASCDHVITTVGTFSWWAGWLSGGEVTFYQWPAVEGSDLRREFSTDYTDFFYPGWIGFM